MKTAVGWRGKPAETGGPWVWLRCLRA